MYWVGQIISVTRFGARLNRLPAASAGDMVLATGQSDGSWQVEETS